MIAPLVSPTEPKELVEELGGVESSIPETRGADVLAVVMRNTPLLVGFQRKRVPEDFVASVEDGRLQKALMLMKGLDVKVLLLEGQFLYDDYDKLKKSTQEGRSYRFTRDQVTGLLLDVKYVQGVDVDYTEDLWDTARVIKRYIRYLEKSKHISILRRGPLLPEWGVASDQERKAFFLQGFSGVGIQIAMNILEHFGGRLPLRWDCTKEELLGVRLIGKKRGELLWSELQGSGTGAGNDNSKEAEVD